jgi:hypothetical protein
MGFVGSNSMSDIIEFNYETGQTTMRDYTEAEISVNEEISIQVDEILSQIPVADQSVVDNLQSAIDKLTSLGLTEAEAKAIAGIREI